MHKAPLQLVIMLVSIHATIGFVRPRSAASFASCVSKGFATLRVQDSMILSAKKRGNYRPYSYDRKEVLQNLKATGAIDFVVWGDPQTLTRHRLGSGHMYNPSLPVQKHFLECAKTALPPTPLTGPLEATIVFRVKRPKNHFRTGKYVTKRQIPPQR